MPTIVDSLFLELGIDVSKFSADQQRALSKIKEFESKTKSAASGARGGIKTVGDAFRELANESSIGSSANRLNSLATKFKSLGASMQVAGGAGTPFGLMARGLGSLLSPATLGIAAIGLLGKGMWDLNSNMTAANATMYRQAQLAGMGATNMWAWGEAAKTVGANPAEVTSGIASLQTAIQGMGIGAGDATGQLIALSRLGVGFNFKSGANIDQLFAEVHKRAKAGGYQNLGALRALTSPLMNDAMFNYATSKDFDPNQVQAHIRGMEGVQFGKTLENSLKSQKVLGDLGIQKDILAETAYGDTQGLLQAVVELLTNLLDIVNRIANFLHVPSVSDGVKGAINTIAGAVGAPLPFVGAAHAPTSMPATAAGRAAYAMKEMLGAGNPRVLSAAIVGNLWQESGLNPMARNGSHAGIMQWDSARQAAFRKVTGYSMGSGGVSPEQQLADQLNFMMLEMRTSENQSARAMAAAGGNLAANTYDFFALNERAGDASYGRRLAFAAAAQQLAGPLGMLAAATISPRPGVQNTITSESHHHGDVHVHTPSTDPRTHGEIVRKTLNEQPLLSPAAQGTVSLATRGMTG